MVVYGCNMNTKAHSPTRAYVLYLRVSTKGQGASGLGLDAQREIAQRMVATEGSSIASEFIEVESGKNNGRPILKQALAIAKKQGATLLVAKLDRLARSVGFVSRLIEAGTAFRAADCPHADKTMLQMLSVMSEWERDQIAKRTKDALAQAKARGISLGNPHPETLAPCRAKWNAVQMETANLRANQVSHIVTGMHSEGRSLSEIANSLEINGYLTSRGGKWSPTHIHRILKRIT